jgi:hypothetical protein
MLFNHDRSPQFALYVGIMSYLFISICKICHVSCVQYEVWYCWHYSKRYFQNEQLMFCWIQVTEEEAKSQRSNVVYQEEENEK